MTSVLATPASPSASQMVAVISNLAPLYARGAPSDSVLRATSDVEVLANAIGVKFLSKAESVRVSSASG
jgi:intracellular sulfur oxidation DsrE/DsrF family protein